METEDKTIEQHFEDFKDPVIWKLAFGNTPPHLLKESLPNIQRALQAAFFWNSTPEGSLFWRTIHDMKDPLLADYNELEKLI